MARFVSLLEGRFAPEWAKFCPQLGTQPNVAQGPQLRVERRTETHRFCGCGLVQRYCAPCDVWVCGAPGHIQHRCRGATE